MKKLSLLLFLASLLPVMWSCSDKEPEINTPQQQTDRFDGPHRIITLGEETAGLHAGDVEISLMSADGTVFSRKAAHIRENNVSTVTLSKGLAEGNYRLLMATYPSTNGSDREEFGLGSRISVTAEGISVLDRFDPVLGYSGAGTKENPYIVSSSSHLFNLMMTVNDYDSNRLITPDTYFQQVCDIDMKQMSKSCDAQYGWLPIGSDTNTPFRGVYLGDGHTISNLTVKRPASSGIGLFGYLFNATIDGLTMKSCTLSGQFAVGSVAGAVITSGGNDRGTGTFTNCKAIDCNISGPATSAAVGGILGATDMYARTLLASCSVSGGSLSGGMNIGGITGGAGRFSSIMISACENSAPVTSILSGTGGIIGTADTLQVVGCTNTARIAGLTGAQGSNPGIGTGGIAGGSGFSWITGSRNTGEVSGIEGVGGIIGSTRIKGSETESFVYNQSVLRYCSNSAPVTGTRFVGGAIGEAQAGGYAVCNSGSVSGTDYVGGICGVASVAVLHNTVNSAPVKGSRYIGGILGKCTWGSLAINQNIADVTASNGHAGGVVSLAGNNSIINYCSNFGTVIGPSSAPVGGIVGEIGDPRKWTALNVVECVVGSLEIVMSVAGPVLAVVEEGFELAEAAEIAIKIVETGVDVALQITDYALFGYGIAEMVNPETESELSAEMHALTEEASAEINSEIAEMRLKCAGSFPNFGGISLTPAYTDAVSQVVGYYETDGNDEKFNEAINETREERGESLERISKAQEIAHTVVAGVAIACSTVAIIGGTIASGGTATAFMVMGSMAALAGGINALVKTCTEFEHNAVVISQCVNSGSISSPGNNSASSIAGKIADGCAIYDCLNTASVSSSNYEAFTGSFGNHCDIAHCVSLVNVVRTSTGSPVTASVVCDTHQKAGQPVTDPYTYVISANPADLANTSIYEKCSFSMGADGLWTIPSGYPFPIPNRSQMQK